MSDSGQQYKERSFLLLVFLVAAAAGCALTLKELFFFVAAVVKGVFRYREKEEKHSSSDEEDFDMLELAPTIDDEEEQEDISEVNGAETAEGKCVVNKAEERVQFRNMPQEINVKSQRTISHPPKQVPSNDDCNRSIDKVSVEIEKSLLEERIERYDNSTAPPFPFEAAEKREQPQDIAYASSTTPKESDEDESIADCNMMKEYEDFLFQVMHSLQ